MLEILDTVVFEEFIPHPVMERLDEPVMPWLTRWYKRLNRLILPSLNIRGCESRSWSGSEPVVIYLDGVGESHLWRVGEPPWLGSFRRVDRSRDERSMYPWYEKLSRS